jgi:hypothetical protein
VSQTDVSAGISEDRGSRAHNNLLPPFHLLPSAALSVTSQTKSAG